MAANCAPKKERYVVYLSPEIGAALRHEKATEHGNTISDITERSLAIVLPMIERERLARSA